MRYGPAEYTSFALSGALVVLIGAIGYRAWKSSRVSPEEAERRRRHALSAGGKMADANLLEFRDSLIFYSYAVRGVEYTASQDISALAARLAAEASVTGPVSVKYDPKNPANSIVVAEEW